LRFVVLPRIAAVTIIASDAGLAVGACAMKPDDFCRASFRSSVTFNAAVIRRPRFPGREKKAKAG
jgi:hypothetical protein